jgi:inhibitor of KinA
VCYEGAYAPDLEDVARQQGLSVREVIELHCAGVYRVYMIGFLPGFPYLGAVDQRLEVPRKPRPVPVAAGGVGIAGKQTGIYPLNSPGGWSIIGRTPVRLFDSQTDPPVRLQTGDRVEFYPIPTEEFRRVVGLSI